MDNDMVVSVPAFVLLGENRWYVKLRKTFFQIETFLATNSLGNQAIRVKTEKKSRPETPVHPAQPDHTDAGGEMTVSSSTETAGVPASQAGRWDIRVMHLLRQLPACARLAVAMTLETGECSLCGRAGLETKGTNRKKVLKILIHFEHSHATVLKDDTPDKKPLTLKLVKR